MEDKQSLAKRRPELDVAKGFVIFLTVFGHVLNHGVESDWIFTFHMPAFFFLSGMTFKPEKYTGFWQLAKDKWKKRICPYLIILLIGFAICMIRPLYRHEALATGWKHLLSWAFYYGQPKELYVGQIWFLIALFWAELAAYIWIKFFQKKNPVLCAYAAMLLAIVSVNIQRINPYLPAGDRLPFKLDTAVAACVFLLAGYYAARTQFFEKLRPAAWGLIPLTIYLSYYFGPVLCGYTNMCDCIYTPAPYYYMSAFLGITPVILTAMVLKNWKFWQFCGRYCLYLFAGQTFAIYWVLELISLKTGITYIPRENMPGEKFSLAVSIAAFALMLVLLWPYARWKEKRAAAKAGDEKERK